MSDKTSLGDRMKEYYENRTRYYLPRRTHAVIRLDGKAFHSYTRGLEKPFSQPFINAMVDAAKAVMSEIQGTCLAYIQSDEVSILIADFNTIQTEAPFDYNIQKLTSVSASIMTWHFNKFMYLYAAHQKPGYFDSRVFSIPERTEVYNYFLWRQRDCIRNSKMGFAQSFFSQKELHKLGANDAIQKVLDVHGQDWNNLPNQLRNGTVLYRDTEHGIVEWHLQDSLSALNEHFVPMIPVRTD
jgi:tRNA(His) guanylyltransferase